MTSLTDRLRGNYAIGPHLPNGKPEFGFRQFEAPPIQHEAADRIEELEKIIDYAGALACQNASTEHIRSKLAEAKREGWGG